MKHLKNTFLAFALALSFLLTTNAQDQVNFNNRRINSFETIEASISNKTLYLAAFKYELREGHPNNTIKGIWQDNVESPKQMSIMFDVEYANGFKFPIKPEDSVFLRVSSIQEAARAQYHFKKIKHKKEALDKGSTEGSEGQMQVIAKQMKALSEQYKKGQISLEEMSEKQQVLTQKMSDIMNGSTVENPNTNPFTGIEDVKDNTYFTLRFDDIPLAQNNIQSTGYVYIKIFNKNEALIEFRGTQEANCYDNPSLYVKGWEEKCKAVSSQVTGQPILHQGALKGSIRVKIRDFKDNRQ